MFATTRWSALPSIWSEMSRLHDEWSRGTGRASKGLRVNAWEEGDRLFVEADLPGLNLDELEILVEGGNELTIRGERKVQEDNEGKWIRRERPSGKVERSFRLPFDVDAEKVEARYKDGVLQIELPKREEDMARRIDVKVG